MGTIGQNSGIKHEMKSSDQTESRHLGGGKVKKGWVTTPARNSVFLSTDFYTNWIKEPQLWCFISFFSTGSSCPPGCVFLETPMPLSIQQDHWEGTYKHSSGFESSSLPTPGLVLPEVMDPPCHSWVLLHHTGRESKEKAHAKLNYCKDTKTSLIINNEPLAILKSELFGPGCF